MSCIFIQDISGQAVLNTFPVPTGKSGIGPGTPPAPENLLHIHGWNPNDEPPHNQYVDPFMRISLESIAGYNYYGMIGLQNAPTLGKTVTPQDLSLLSKATVADPSNKYDFVITTSHLTDPVLAFNYDLILSAKNRKASIRFATTPPTAPPMIMNDKERMTIAPYGSIGVGTPFPYPPDKINIHYIDNPQHQFPNTPFPAIKLSIHPDEPADPTDAAHYHSMNLAIAPCDGCYGSLTHKYDAVVNGTAGDLILQVDKAANDPWANLNPRLEAGAIRFNTHPVHTGPVLERMTILGSGKVGISQTDPKELLHIGQKLTFHSGLHQVIGANAFWDGVSRKRIGTGGASMLFFDNGNVDLSVFPSDIAGSDLLNGHHLTWNVNGLCRIGDADPAKQVAEKSKLNVSGDIYLGEGNMAHKIRWNDPANDRHWIGYTPDRWWMNFTSHENEGFIFRNATDGEIMTIFGSVAANGDEFFAEPKTQFQGRVYIGTHNPGVVPAGSPMEGQRYSLAVNGAIKGRELVIKSGEGEYIAWPDYVFKESYDLMPLSDLEGYVKEHSRLPDMPSAEEVNADGISVGAMQAKLLKKIEELTLYVIELKKENQELRDQVSVLDVKN